MGRLATRAAATTVASCLAIGAVFGAGGDELGHVVARGQTHRPSAALVADKGVDSRGSAFARPVKAYPLPGFDFVDDEGNLYTCVLQTSTASPSSVIRYFEWKGKTIRCYRLAHPEEQPHTHQEPAAPPPK